MASRKVKKMSTDEGFISTLIRHLGCTKTEFAERVGWSKQRVNHLTKKAIGFDIKKIGELRRKLNLSVQEMTLLVTPFLD